MTTQKQERVSILAREIIIFCGLFCEKFLHSFLCFFHITHTYLHAEKERDSRERGGEKKSSQKKKKNTSLLFYFARVTF